MSNKEHATPTTRPILAAFHTTPATWEVWCEHCRRWHTHGSSPGHRAAHCDHERLGRDGLMHPAPRWEHGYHISDQHPDAHTKRQRDRPKLPPIGEATT